MYVVGLYSGGGGLIVGGLRYINTENVLYLLNVIVIVPVSFLVSLTHACIRH